MTRSPRIAHGDLTSLAPHERLPENLVVPREKSPTDERHPQLSLATRGEDWASQGQPKGPLWRASITGTLFCSLVQMDMMNWAMWTLASVPWGFPDRNSVMPEHISSCLWLGLVLNRDVLEQWSPTPGPWTVRKQAVQQKVRSRQATKAPSAAPHLWRCEALGAIL